MRIDVQVGLERGGLVGRERELALASRVTLGGRRPPVLFIHGPGGIGKSALLRELVRGAAGLGRRSVLVDGREVAPRADALAIALDRAGHDAGAEQLVVLDSFELIEPTTGYIRERLLPELGEGSALCVAGRNPPDRPWFNRRWTRTLRELRLGPLDERASLMLAGRHDVDAAAAARIVAWAKGHPLSITLAARVLSGGSDWRPGEAPTPADLAAEIVHSLGESDVEAGHLPTLAAAAIARSTTPALLGAVLTEHDAPAEWRWLASRSFVEPVGEGVALHALLRDAVRDDLRRRDPMLERKLKRRIADHVYSVAQRTGELDLVVDLSHLIENPGLRWFLWETSPDFYLDRPRPGDAIEISRLFTDGSVTPVGGGLAAWELTRSCFERMPEFGVVARDAAGSIVGFTFVPTTAVQAPELEHAPLMGPCLRHARSLDPPGEAVVMPYMCDLTGDLGSGLIGMLANAALLRSARSNPRYTYMTIDRDLEYGRIFAEAVGATRVPEADTPVGETVAQAWLIDYGAGGFLAHQRELVYRELGLDPPARPREGSGSVRPEQIRDALRNLDHPTVLSASALAVGEGVRDRANSVRELLFQATEEAFGDQPGERLLRDVIRRGYFEPAPSHEAAAAELYLSRSAYFRRLKQAVDRLAEYIASAR